MNELSLIDFFKKYSRIEIPKIQRDYAQGRENESEVADRFLDKIFECLKEKDNKNLELDFIYGSVNNKTVYLLDGQQRVTTLFLLHWYIVLREDRFNEEIKECLKKFTYSTRVSSREFCQNIIDNDNIKNIKGEISKKEKDKKNKLSDIIKDFYWFTNENDPTIKAMLNMIDKIDKKYNEIVKDNNSIKLFDRLEKIQFYFLPMEDFKLTDEIYLKMNARGKPLTSFENFKADFTYYIQKNNIDISQQQLSDLDNKYTNFFWQLYKRDKKYDNLYIKFFYRITLIYFIINNEDVEKLTDNEYYKYLKSGSFEELNEKNKYSSFNAFKETYDKNICDESKNVIKIIFKVLDILEHEYSNNILNTIKPIWDQNDYDILSKIKYEYKDIIIFSALIFYIEKNDYYKKSFKQWMRIVWNITENSNINEYSSIRLIKLFNELSEYSSNIYNFLADEKNIIDTNISKEAVQYERRKCKFLKRRGKLIIKDKNWEKFFIKAEKYKFFKGYIDFLIDDNMDINKFNHRVKLFCSMFNDDGKYTFDEEHLFLRALISNITDINDFRNKKVRISDNLKNLINILKDKCYDNDTHDYIKKLLDSKNKYKLKKKLENEVSKDSKINLTGYSSYLKERIKFAHEALKDSVLQNWIYAVNENNKHKNTTMIVDWRDHCLYLLFPRLDRVLIGSYRNQLISDLLKDYKYMITNYDNIKNINNAYYTGSDIEIKIKNENEEYILKFDKSNKLTIKKGDEVILKDNLDEYTFKDYKKRLQDNFLKIYIKNN